MEKNFPDKKIIAAGKATLVAANTTSITYKFPTRQWGTLIVTNEHFIFAVDNTFFKLLIGAFILIPLIIGGMDYITTGTLEGFKAIIAMLPGIIIIGLISRMKSWLSYSTDRSNLAGINVPLQEIKLRGQFINLANTNNFVGTYRIRINENFNEILDVINNKQKNENDQTII